MIRCDNLSCGTRDAYGCYVGAGPECPFFMGVVTYVLNVPVLTNYGTFRFRKVSVEEAKKELVGGFISAVGHEGTAKVLSELLGISIPYNRIEIKMKPGDRAVVFRLLKRLPEGTVLSKEELLQLPFELGVLECLE